MKRFVKPIVFLVIMAGIFALSRHYGWTEIFINSVPKFREYVNHNPVKAMAVYILATSAGCVLLAMPGAIFAVIAGLLFEPFTGTVLCLTAATLGAVLAFLAGRYFLRASVRPMLEKSAVLKKILFDDAEHSGMILLMVTRLVPLFPYNLQNFAYGLTDIKLLPYTVYTFLFMAPGAAAFTLGAAGIGNSERRKLYLFLAVILAVIVTVSGIILRKKFVRR
ncbi:MAG: TVP38/TMEM64 family protein [Synergistaceae bacterium]|nr:TVP38/TMEM64 family protein [Synergistaceae bacterium]